MTASFDEFFGSVEILLMRWPFVISVIKILAFSVQLPQSYFGGIDSMPNIVKPCAPLDNWSKYKYSFIWKLG